MCVPRIEFVADVMVNDVLYYQNFTRTAQSVMVCFQIQNAGLITLKMVYVLLQQHVNFVECGFRIRRVTCAMTSTVRFCKKSHTPERGCFIMPSVKNSERNTWRYVFYDLETNMNPFQRQIRGHMLLITLSLCLLVAIVVNKLVSRAEKYITLARIQR